MQSPKVLNPKASLQILTMGLGVLLLMALLLLPLPPWLLDLLLVSNMGFCLLLLFSTLVITQRLSLSAFPSFLLMATLFRLGLNVASTRLILTQGQAGHLITALGHLATGGSWAIGLLLFALLTLVQFLVIAKGAERVAEVGARFSLDALPGKQMSIDADLRAGIIPQEQAKAQREELQQTSSLFGAMDGAMKFVKGDAIAGVVITLLNFFGGLFLGIIHQDLSLEKALKTYSILSIGDGLISQLTGQLVALSAAFMVTAVDDSSQQNSLVQNLGSQLLAQPKLISACALLFLVFSLLPGVPAYPFWILSGTLLGFRGVLAWTARQRAKAMSPFQSQGLEHNEGNISHQPAALSLQVSAKSYTKMLQQENWQRAFYQLYPQVKNYLTQKTGVSFPELSFRPASEIHEEAHYQIALWGTPVFFGKFTSPQPVLEVLKNLGQVLKTHCKEFLGIQEVQDRLRDLEKDYPDLVREVIPKWITLQRLTEVLQRLAEEGIPLHDLRSILQILAGSPSEQQDTVALTDLVRAGLKRTLSSLYANSQKQVFAFQLSPQIEEEVKKSIHRHGQACYLTLKPERITFLAEEFRLQIKRQLNHFKHELSLKEIDRPVILTQGELRRYVRKLIELALPEVPVLAYEELTPEIKLKSLGTLSVGIHTSLTMDTSPQDQEVTQLAGVG